MRGFEEDRRTMDGSEECGESLHRREEEPGERPILPQFFCSVQDHNRFSICRRASIKMKTGSYPTRHSACVGRYVPEEKRLSYA